MVYYNSNKILSLYFLIYTLFIVKFKLLFKRNDLILTIMNLVREVFYISIVYMCIYILNYLKLWHHEIVNVSVLFVRPIFALTVKVSKDWFRTVYMSLKTLLITIEYLFKAKGLENF